MALDRFNENMDIIAGLGDDPKRDDGLSTPQFKSVFDKAGLLIQKFLNEKLIPQVENFLDEGTVLGKITEALSRKLDKTGGTMEGPINMNGQSLSGLNAPTKDDEAATKGYADELKNDTETYVNNAVRTAAPRNLLDNSDFRNPVNQRGITSIVNHDSYTLDRWLMYRVWEMESNSLTINDGYISLGENTKFEQRLSSYKEDTVYTAATMNINGELNVVSGKFSSDEQIGDRVYLKKSASSGSATVGFLSGDYLWAALYEGEYTVETLPVYQPKGYGAELLECLRYFYRFDASDNGMFFPIVTGISQVPGFLFPVIMRIAPTMTIEHLQTWTTAGFTDVSGRISSKRCTKGGLQYIELDSTVVTNGGVVSLVANFSADL